MSPSVLRLPVSSSLCQTFDNVNDSIFANLHPKLVFNRCNSETFDEG